MRERKRERKQPAKRTRTAENRERSRQERQVIKRSNSLAKCKPHHSLAATLIEADPDVEQSGSSGPITYAGEVVNALNAANRLASSSVAPRDPSPHSIEAPTMPDGGEGDGVQSGVSVWALLMNG